MNTNKQVEDALVNSAVELLAVACLHGHTDAVESGRYTAEQLNAYISHKLIDMVESVQKKADAILCEK